MTRAEALAWSKEFREPLRALVGGVEPTSSFRRSRGSGLCFCGCSTWALESCQWGIWVTSVTHMYVPQFLPLGMRVAVVPPHKVGMGSRWKQSPKYVPGCAGCKGDRRCSPTRGDTWSTVHAGSRPRRPREGASSWDGVASSAVSAAKP